jgi:NAD-dependent dihydropyrimidine dehydrogenase PreA subunit
MALKWYPFIDYMLCEECGSCINKCSHGVYDEEKAPTPIVIQREECIDHCHGCGDLCPVGAISYVGEDTGWVPPIAKKEENQGCGCDGGCGSGCGCGCDGGCDSGE